MTAAITVIIPTFNRQTLVPLAINSVLAQTRPAAEIIVVDDGSDQDMCELLAVYGARVRVIRQANSGLSAARNTGILAATTEWVAFLDDDDEFEPERLAQAAAGILQFPLADVHATNTAIVGAGAAVVDLFRLRELKLTEATAVQSPLIWVLRGCFFAQSLVVRRSTINAAGLFRKTFYEDLDLYVRLTNWSPWILYPEPGLRLIRRENTAAMSDEWRARPVARCEALVRIFREALDLPWISQAEAREVRTGLATYLYELGTALYVTGERERARASFAEAARCFPARHSRFKATICRFGGLGLITLLQRIKTRKRGLVR